MFYNKLDMKKVLNYDAKFVSVSLFPLFLIVWIWIHNTEIK